MTDSSITCCNCFFPSVHCSSTRIIPPIVSDHFCLHYACHHFFGRLQYTGVKQDELRCTESAAFTEAFVTKDKHSILGSAKSYGGSRCRRRRGPGPSAPGPDFEFGRWLFPASSPVRAAPARRAVTTNGHSHRMLYKCRPVRPGFL